MDIFARLVVGINPRSATLVGTMAAFFAYSILYICLKNVSSSILLISLALVLVDYGAISGLYPGIKMCTAIFPNYRCIANKRIVSP